VIRDSNLPATAKALAKLIAQKDHFLFNGHVPVRIAVEADCMPRALEVTVEALRIYAHEISRPIKIRKVKDKDTGAETFERIPTTLPKDVAALYLNGLEGQWGLPLFRGITTAPILAADGSIRTATGYDPESQLYCHNIPRIIVADNPTYQDAMNALRGLRMFFCTFPFADSKKKLDPKLGVHVVDQDEPIGMDESTFLVALVTAVCRPSLDFAPAFLARAPNISGAGTGKGYLVKAIAIVSSGAKPAAFTGGHDKEEFEKRMTAALIEAQPVVFLDNHNAQELKSDVLASALTEDPAKVRPFGVTAQVPLHTRTFIVITGNGVEIAEDMARRILVTDIDAGMADPEARPFAPGFLDRVFEARAKLLTHALTIWRWGRQNEQKPGKPLGNYETWAQWCRDPLLTLKCRDPVDRIAEIKAADPRRRALVEIFDTWWTFHGNTTMKATDLAIEVLELIDTKAVRVEEGTDPIDPSKKLWRLKYNRQSVASWLSRHGRTCLGGFTLSMSKDKTLRRPIAYYTLKKEEEKL
jgi:hypothetical protein